ncbi:methyl-accepting chemotaxis protein [Gymnodinialimonas sp. 2305UL16-5]|uniref:methyl-accepting chemotaxis protein n=1 Tax=Gymnodinialimonas mytili TaxID=3126503 RepID=UPI00309D8BA3
MDAAGVPSQINADDPAQTARAPSHDGLNRLGQLADHAGQNIVKLAGQLDRIDAESKHQLDMVDRTTAQTQNLLRVTQQMNDELVTVSDANARALDTVKASVTALRESSDRSQEVASWVGDLDGALGSVEATLSAVSQANGRIAQIAKQVNILAVNAKIEAARAGEMGRGFAVVAEAINALSRETAQAAQDVTGSTTTLTGLLSGLRKDARDVADQAKAVLEGASSADDALAQINVDVTSAAQDTKKLTDDARDVFGIIRDFAPDFEDLANGLRNTAAGVHRARDRAEEVVTISERAVQVSVQLGAASHDGPMIELVMDRAAEISALFEHALDAGQISADKLFAQQYTPIPGTDPQQVMAPFTAFTDRVLPAIQEPVVASDPRIVMCAAVDRNGYLPTHNLSVSHPQGDDPVWNAAHCRNRRIFYDRVGLKSGRDTEPFLMQTYLRDMGGGTHVLMKNVSAPIIVNGRHWGGLRLGLSLD